MRRRRAVVLTRRGCLCQAPGTDEEERAWAHKKFGFEFPVFDHVDVLDKPTPMWQGPTEISPVYRFLKVRLRSAKHACRHHTC